MDLSWVGTIKLLQSRAVLMHNPISPLSFRCTTTVEDQSLLHSNQDGPRFDFTILSSCLPIPISRCPVQSMPIWILAILWTEEEPLWILVPDH